MANTQTTEKKQSAKQKKILVASILLAATITAGSTFAWFTSKDEVTNRLSASAEYGVAIAESFQPPENWVPGQEINKDASAVNTGNVDAFVRMWLTGSMRLLQQNTTGSGTTIAGYSNGTFGTAAPTTAVTDSSLLNAGLTLMDDSGNYYKTLSATQAQNAHLTYEGTHEGYPDNRKTAYSEIQSMQSGILAYAPDDAEYTYILNEETELPIYVKIGSNTTAEYKKISVPAGTLVHVVKDDPDVAKAATYDTTSGTLTINEKEQVTNASGTGEANKYDTVYVKAQAHDDNNTFFVPQDIEYETFTPLTDGLYLFLRNEDNANQADPEFSGYYRSKQSINNNETNVTESDKVVYYALNTDTQRANRSDYTVKGAETPTYAAPVTVKYDDNTNKKNIVHVVPSANLELYTAQYSDVSNNNNLKFYANDNSQTIYAIYDKDNDTAFNADKDIAVEIKLANVGTAAEQWTPIGGTTSATYTGITGLSTVYDATNLTFYYNNDVEAGDSTENLVDMVKLYDGVTNKAYLAFDFDLNVNLESIQVTFDENGNEQFTPVNPWNASGNVTAATGSSGSGTGKEIESITWQNP